MPSDIQVHTQVSQNNAKISEETKLVLHKIFDSIMSKSNKDIGQTDLIEMHITTRLDSAPVAAQPYPLTLKHHDFLKQGIKFTRCRNYPHEHVLMGKPSCSCEKHTPEGSLQQFRLCIDYRKLNSVLPSVTPATGTKKGAFALMPLPKIDGLFTLLKGAKYITALDLCIGYYHIKLDKESIPKVLSQQYLASLNFWDYPLACLKAQTSPSVFSISSWTQYNL